jgi:hypothetical protein
MVTITGLTGIVLGPSPRTTRITQRPSLALLLIVSSVLLASDATIEIWLIAITTQSFGTPPDRPSVPLVLSVLQVKGAQRLPRYLATLAMRALQLSYKRLYEFPGHGSSPLKVMRRLAREPLVGKYR